MNKSKMIALGAVMILSACATPPKVTSSSEATVMIHWRNLDIDREVSEIMPLAEKECAKYGKHARYSGRTGTFEEMFNCVS